MSSPDEAGARSAATVCALLVLLALPLAAGHGDAPPFDPLVVDMHLHLHADRTMAEAAPDEGAVAFAAIAPGSAPTAVEFAAKAPVAFAPAGTIDVELTLRADQLVVARDADGDALELQVAPDGPPLRVALADSLLTPGTVALARASLAVPARTFEEGEEIRLVVRPLMPALAEGALSIVVGGDTPSRVDFREMRVPSPADLRLQDVPHTEYLVGVDRFEPPADHAANVFRVAHDSVAPPATTRFSAAGTYVILEGAEADGGAHRFPDRARRIDAAHEFTVNGVLARVHPGLGVIVRVESQPTLVQCVRNCPAGGFSATVGESTNPSTGEPPSVLVPPPRDTTGIPVSEDEPPAAKTPLGGALAAAALLVGALARRGR